MAIFCAGATVRFSYGFDLPLGKLEKSGGFNRCGGMIADAANEVRRKGHFLTGIVVAKFIPAFGHHVQNVIARCANAQVFWIAARRVIAGMHDYLLDVVRGDFAHNQRVGNPVAAKKRAVKLEPPIPHVPGRTMPVPAFVFTPAINARPKAALIVGAQFGNSDAFMGHKVAFPVAVTIFSPSDYIKTEFFANLKPVTIQYLTFLRRVVGRAGFEPATRPL